METGEEPESQEMAVVLHEVSQLNDACANVSHTCTHPLSHYLLS